MISEKASFIQHIFSEIPGHRIWDVCIVQPTSFNYNSQIAAILKVLVTSADHFPHHNCSWMVGTKTLPSAWNTDIQNPTGLCGRSSLICGTGQPS